MVEWARILRGKICKGKLYVLRLILQGLSYRKQFANHEPTKLHRGLVTLSSFDLPPKSTTTSTKIRHWERPTAALAEASLLAKFNAKENSSAPNREEQKIMQSIIKQLPSEFIPATKDVTQQEVGYGIYLVSRKIRTNRIFNFIRNVTHIFVLVLIILWLCYEEGKNFMIKLRNTCLATVAIVIMLKVALDKVNRGSVNVK